VLEAFHITADTSILQMLAFWASDAENGSMSSEAKSAKVIHPPV